MKPARQKTIQLLLFAGLIINLSSTCVFAIDEPSIDNAPVIGEFLYDEEMAAIIEEKEAEMFSAPQPYAISKLLPINQVAQERSNWCGYASIESILNYENIFKTQSQIAIAIRGANNMDSSCPWLWSNGDTMDQFPVPNYLNEQLNTGSFLYVPYPFGDAGATTLTANDVKTRVTTTINKNHGVLACGVSKGGTLGHPSILPNYPNRDIGHWIVIRGYNQSGDTIHVVDPAKSDAVSFSQNISSFYSISADTLAAFASSRGIVW